MEYGRKHYLEYRKLKNLKIMAYFLFWTCYQQIRLSDLFQSHLGVTKFREQVRKGKKIAFAIKRWKWLRLFMRCFYCFVFWFEKVERFSNFFLKSKTSKWHESFKSFSSFKSDDFDTIWYHWKVFLYSFKKPFSFFREKILSPWERCQQFSPTKLSN